MASAIVNTTSQYDYYPNLPELKRQLTESKEKLTQLCENLVKKRKEIKDLVSQNKKLEARNKAKVALILKSEGDQLETLCSSLEKQLKSLNRDIKSMELDSNPIDFQQKEQLDHEINTLIGELAAGSQSENEEIDNLMQDFENDIKMEDVDEGMGSSQVKQSLKKPSAMSMSLRNISNPYAIYLMKKPQKLVNNKVVI